MNDDTLFFLSWKIFVGATLTSQEQVLWDHWQIANPALDCIAVLQANLHAYHLMELEKALIVEEFWREHARKFCSCVPGPDIAAESNRINE